MIRLGIRQLRLQTLIWGGFFAFYSVFIVGSMDKVYQGPVRDRLALLASLQQIGNTSGWFLPAARRIDTVPGYYEWQGLGTFVLAFAIWGCVAGTGLMRGDEERGITEVLLAGGLLRWRIVVQRALAYACSMGSVLAFGGLVVYLVGLLGPAHVGPAGLAGQLLAFSGVAMVCCAVGLVTSQLFPTRRNALGVAATVVVALFVVNGFGRIRPGLRPIRVVSPFFYYDQSDALVPGGHLSVSGVAVLFGVTVLLVALAALLFAHRDVGASLIRPRRSTGHLSAPSANPLLRHALLAALWDQRIGLLIWIGAVGFYAATLVSLANGFANAATAQTAGSLGAVSLHVFGLDRGRHPALGFVAVAWFSTACLLLAFYAVTQVARWSADDVEGRLEMALSAGWPRWRVMLDRSAALVLGSLAILAGSAVGVIAGGATIGLTFDAGHLLLATVLVVPVTFAFGAAGAALAALRPRVAVGALASVALLSYFIPFGSAPAFAPKAPPKWFLDLSVFQLYGTPLLDGVYWTGFFVLTAVIVLGMAAATLLMLRREVGR